MYKNKHVSLKHLGRVYHYSSPIDFEQNYTSRFTLTPGMMYVLKGLNWEHQLKLRAENELPLKLWEVLMPLRGRLSREKHKKGLPGLPLGPQTYKVEPRFKRVSI